MTGRSPNIADPQFEYDASGLECLDTLQDFISQNNHDGLSAVEWKNRYWQDARQYS